MRDNITRQSGVFTWWSLAVRGARLQFSLAVALISVIPSLSLLYLAGGAAWRGSSNTQAWCVALFGVATSMILGYCLLAKYPATVIKLRAYVHDMVSGEFPNRISLVSDEDDITAIESGMNLLLGRLRDRLQTVEAQKTAVEEQLFQARKMEALGTLASGIAHEINTPLQFISNNIQFLKTATAGFVRTLDNRVPPTGDNAGGVPGADLAFLRKETATAIEQSQEGIARIAEIVRAIRGFADTGAQDERTPLDINEAIEATIALTRNNWKYAAAIVTDFDRSLPRVPCVAAEIQRVLLNLILNAAEALAVKAQGRSLQEGRIRIATGREADAVTITVADNGPGIPKRIQGRIFDPFFTTKEVGHGIGEGLSFVYSSVVNRHAGRLAFESVEGEGATFRISLPLVKGSEQLTVSS